MANLKALREIHAPIYEYGTLICRVCSTNSEWDENTDSEYDVPDSWPCASAAILYTDAEIAEDTRVAVARREVEVAAQKKADEKWWRKERRERRAAKLRTLALIEETDADLETVARSCDDFRERGYLGGFYLQKYDTLATIHSYLRWSLFSKERDLNPEGDPEGSFRSGLSEFVMHFQVLMPFGVNEAPATFLGNDSDEVKDMRKLATSTLGYLNKHRDADHQYTDELVTWGQVRGDPYSLANILERIQRPTVASNG